ncbi:amino acid/polyamine transporter I [Ilyonectria sp. MPI-CAGE-AT-0026]|nr:amino acid/polyamine transporter I [Ilyonectria sp. MPI-CAGE-AT-0026]
MAPDRSDDAAAHQPLLLGQRASDDEASRLEQGTFTRNLGAIEAFAIVISIVIGSGVFTSPGSIDTNVPSPGVALIIWLVGGILAWTGASTFAELGTAIPGEGGVQPYLRHIYGDVYGFLSAWTWIVAIMPATLAILSIVFVESAYSAAGVMDGAGQLSHKLLSILVLLVMSVANSISTKASTQLNSYFVVLKFTSIAAVVVAAAAVVGLQLASPERDIGGRDWYTKHWFAYRKSSNPDGSETDWAGLSQWEIFGHYSAALYGALWAYSGWDKAIYVSAELSEPARQLPLAINTSIPTAIVCFLAANAAYYILLPWKVVSTTDSVAVTAITALLGRGFGIIAAVMICLVVAGSLLGNSFVASRMTVAAANRGWIPRVFTVVGTVGRKSDHDGSTDSSENTSDAPINAIILSAFLATIYILFGSFRALLTLNGLGEYSFFFLTVLGAVLLRYREPDLHRPYKPFIVNHFLFLVVSGFVVARGAAFAPFQALIMVAIWILGLGFYKARKRHLE